MFMNSQPFLLSNRVKVVSPLSADPLRYQFLNLSNAEPNLGIPNTNIAAFNTYVLTTDNNGTRQFNTTTLYDSTYTTLYNTSGAYQSVFTTVNVNSGNWDSTYSTVKNVSSTWLTETSASGLYFKLSGGELAGSVRIAGDMVVTGSLTALGNINYVTTSVTTTSALSVINTGYGPALYVSQDNIYDIASFVDKEGGVVLQITNIDPPNGNGAVGIRTDVPNETLTVVGTISGSSNIYTGGEFVSGGINIQNIFDSAYLPTIESTYSSVSINSASWSSVYSSYNLISSQYTTKAYLSSNVLQLSGANIAGDLRVVGSLFALGSSYFVNTSITTTSALSVVSYGQGPALHVFQGPGGGDIASFFDGDGIEVFHIGNALLSPGSPVDGVVGIKTSYPNKTLTVVGEISATSFINNIALKYDADSIFLGQNYSQINSGLNNIFIGKNVASSNQFGSDNIFVGVNAGTLNVDANNNIFIGSNTGSNNIVGERNTIIGINAGVCNIGYSNTILGHQAGQVNVGDSNVFIGRNAGQNNIGSDNVLIGNNAGQSSITSNDNIIIGSTADVVNSPTNVLVIGKGAIGSDNNQLVIGSPTYRYHTGTIWTNRLSINNILSAQQTSVFNLTGTNSRFNQSNVLTRFISNNITELSGTNGLSGLNYLVGTNVISGSNIVRGDTTVTSTITVSSIVTGAIAGTLTTTVSGTITLFNSGGTTFEASNQYIKIPSGTTFQRPVCAADGYIRYNTSLSAIEMYYGRTWRIPYATQHIDLTTSRTYSATPLPVNTTVWVNTTTSPITALLPTSPVRGDTVRFLDLARTFNTNNLTLSSKAGQTIQGAAEVLTVATQGAAFDLIFYDNTWGWRIFSI